MSRKKAVEQEDEIYSTTFTVNINGKEERVACNENNWMLQQWRQGKDKNGKDTSHWESYKWFADLGSLAARVYDLRLKHTDANNIKDLKAYAKQIAIEVRKEFSLNT